MELHIPVRRDSVEGRNAWQSVASPRHRSGVSHLEPCNRSLFEMNERTAGKSCRRPRNHPDAGLSVAVGGAFKHTRTAPSPHRVVSEHGAEVRFVKTESDSACQQGCSRGLAIPGRPHRRTDRIHGLPTPRVQNASRRPFPPARAHINGRTRCRHPIACDCSFPDSRHAGTTASTVVRGGADRSHLPWRKAVRKRRARSD